MEVEEITIETFIDKINNGQKLFKNICVENYYFFLEDSILDEVEFQWSFVNINFKNCSLKKAKFLDCNLKCISFINCDLSECTISECAIESLEIKNCDLNGIIFGRNFSYGNILTPQECLEFFIKENAT